MSLSVSIVTSVISCIYNVAWGYHHHCGLYRCWEGGWARGWAPQDSWVNNRFFCSPRVSRIFLSRFSLSSVALRKILIQIFPFYLVDFINNSYPKWIAAEFSQTDQTHVISTQIKTKDKTGTPSIPILCFFLTLGLRQKNMGQGKGWVWGPDATLYSKRVSSHLLCSHFSAKAFIANFCFWWTYLTGNMNRDKAWLQQGQVQN